MVSQSAADIVEAKRSLLFSVALLCPPTHLRSHFTLLKIGV